MKCKTPTCHRRRTHYAKHGYCELHARYHKVTNSFISARYCIRLVQHLHQQGVSISEISRGSSVDRGTIALLNREAQGKVRQSVQRKLVTYAANLNLDEVRAHPVWPTARRLQALQAAGWSQYGLAEALGSSQPVICGYTHGVQEAVPPGLARRVNDLYREHETDPVGTPTCAAKQAGWVPPMWWDDIDDPEELPGKTHCRVCHRANIHAHGMCQACSSRAYREAKNQKGTAA